MYDGEAEEELLAAFCLRFITLMVMTLISFHFTHHLLHSSIHTF